MVKKLTKELKKEIEQRKELQKTIESNKTQHQNGVNGHGSTTEQNFEAKMNEIKLVLFLLFFN